MNAKPFFKTQSPIGLSTVEPRTDNSGWRQNLGGVISYRHSHAPPCHYDLRGVFESVGDLAETTADLNARDLADRRTRQPALVAYAGRSTEARNGPQSKTKLVRRDGRGYASARARFAPSSPSGYTRLEHAVLA